jgi:hypothetical protein
MASADELKIRSAWVLPSLGPVYQFDDRNRRELIGTSVFFTYESKHFVLSARHVLIRDRPVHVGGDTTIVPLVGRFFHSGDACNGSVEYDLAFFPLTDEQVAALPGVAFVTTSDVELDPPPSSNVCYATGFLIRDFEDPAANHEIVVEGTAIGATVAGADKYAALGASADAHLLLAFDRLATYSAPGRMEPTPKLHGMSGAGVWRFHGGSPTGDKLAAILIEHHQQDHKVIVATRVSEFFRSLEAYLSGTLS